jgi:formiminoglutamate deiminase
MSQLFFDNCLLPEGWARNVMIEADPDGWIVAVNPDSAPDGVDDRAAIALPGIPNCHSHAFQRAMAGLTERRGQVEDSFWTWRDLMYRFVDKITPDDLAAIAAQVYLEMLEAGFTAVAEFHYLHHAPQGRPFDDIAEMSQAIFAAAQETGIGLTFLPVFYESSGFGGAEPTEAQERFALTPYLYGQLLERVTTSAGELPDATVGMAPHSLRAVTPDGLNEILKLPCAGPVHIHIAEQVREIEDCLAWSGVRPVQWLLDNAAVDGRWCLVHATHMDSSEIAGVANSTAVAGLCPITEANLGDGIFEGVEFAAQGGRFAIGSDSNIYISAAEELRLLEYAQRLRDRGRNRLAGSQASTGASLINQVLAGGAQASGRRIGRIEAGYRADIIALDQNHAGLIARQGDAWLDGWIFAGDNAVVSDVWVGGQHLVQNGRHIARDTVSPVFANVLSHLVVS